jgi:hypothetical protein
MAYAIDLGSFKLLGMFSEGDEVFPTATAKVLAAAGSS